MVWDSGWVQAVLAAVALAITIYLAGWWAQGWLNKRFAAVDECTEERRQITERFMEVAEKNVAVNERVTGVLLRIETRLSEMAGRSHEEHEQTRRDIARIER